MFSAGDFRQLICDKPAYGSFAMSVNLLKIFLILLEIICYNAGYAWKNEKGSTTASPSPSEDVTPKRIILSLKKKLSVWELMQNKMIMIPLFAL